jgi:hypothetical protein
MIYLKEEIARHRKFALAGSMLKGGVFSALGLYVAGLGWALEQHTDGKVDDEFLATFPPETRVQQVANVLSSRRVRLWHRVKGGYQIHDFHDVNESADKRKHRRKLATQRQRRKRERDHATSTPTTVNVTRDSGVTPRVTTCARVPYTIPSTRTRPLFGLDRSEPDGRALSDDPSTSTGIQRPDGRDAHTLVEMSAERRLALSTEPADDDNYRSLMPLGYDVLEQLGDVDADSGEFRAALKDAARANLMLFPDDVIARVSRSISAARKAAQQSLDSSPLRLYGGGRR